LPTDDRSDNRSDNRPDVPRAGATETIAALHAENERLRGALHAAEEELATERAAVRELTVHDELTGLLNRREMKRLLTDEVMRARRYKHPLSLLLVDVDDLARINAEHGTPMGDEVLRSVAAVLRANLRPVDRPARYGGAELAVLLPDTFANDGVQVAERLRSLVAEAAGRTKSAATTRPKVTISVGVAGIHESEKSADELLQAADVALKEAKDRGRNAVVAFVDLKLPTARA
jgi:two-component system cell cycle response regulator